MSTLVWLRCGAGQRNIGYMAADLGARSWAASTPCKDNPFLLRPTTNSFRAMQQQDLFIQTYMAKDEGNWRNQCDY